jgi:hypothetical protein
VEVNIGEVHSTVRATDGSTLLSPRVLERIVAAVLERLREEDAHQHRAREERHLDSGHSAQER